MPASHPMYSRRPRSPPLLSLRVPRERESYSVVDHPNTRQGHKRVHDPRPAPGAVRAQNNPHAAHRVSREEGPVVDHLDEDAANGPDVYGGGVGLGAEQDLGGAVPQRDDLGVG